jgi:hypothetical protein
MISGQGGAEKEEENMTSNQLSEVFSPNNIIKSIIIRMVGDVQFIFKANQEISFVLYDNYELYKVFVYSLIQSDKNIKEFFIYDLNPADILKLKMIPGKDPKKPYYWNFSLIFKAYSEVFANGLEYESKQFFFNGNFDSLRNYWSLKDDDFIFINYITKEQINPEGAENWKRGFGNISKFITQDLMHSAKCERSLKLIGKFLALNSIQKFIIEEIYHDLDKFLKELMVIKLKEPFDIIIKYLNQWSEICGPLHRDMFNPLRKIKFGE